MWNNITKNIFFIDAIGALITAILVLFLVGGLPSFFGLEPKICKILGLIALGFFAYSLINHFLIPKSRYFVKRLTIISILNLLYAFVTFSLVFGILKIGSKSELTTMGKLYFIGEIIVVLIIVGIELRIVLEKKKQTQLEKKV